MRDFKEESEAKKRIQSEIEKLTEEKDKMCMEAAFYYATCDKCIMAVDSVIYGNTEEVIPEYVFVSSEPKVNGEFEQTDNIFDAKMFGDPDEADAVYEQLAVPSDRFKVVRVMDAFNQVIDSHVRKISNLKHDLNELHFTGILR